MRACCKFADISDWFRSLSELEWIEAIELHTNSEGGKAARGRREVVG